MLEEKNETRRRHSRCCHIFFLLFFICGEENLNCFSNQNDEQQGKKENEKNQHGDLEDGRIEEEEESARWKHQDVCLTILFFTAFHFKKERKMKLKVQVIHIFNSHKQLLMRNKKPSEMISRKFFKHKCEVKLHCQDCIQKIFSFFFECNSSNSI